jgi:hypothetical protein
MVDYDSLPIVREAQSSPRAYDAEAVKRDLQIYADEVLIALGARAPSPIPGESKQLYLARIGETAAEFGPKERRSLDRRAMPFRDVAEVVRADLDYARAEIDNPKHSLRDGEVRELVRLDDSGRPVTTWHTRTEGCRWWMDQFASPVRRYVSQGSKGFATPKHSRPDGYVFDKADLPEYREFARRSLEAEFSATIEARRQAGLPPPTLEDLCSWKR